MTSLTHWVLDDKRLAVTWWPGVTIGAFTS